MKFRKTFLCFLIIGSFLLFTLSASADDMLVGFSDPECTAGENVTVEMWAEDGLSSIEVYLTFDTGMLEFLPGSSSGGTSNATIKLAGSGRIQIVDWFSEGSGKFTYSLVFRALKAGTTTVNTDKGSSTITVGRDDVTDSVAFYYSEVTIRESTSPTTPEPATEPPQTEPPAPPTTPEPQTEPPTTRALSSEKRLASLSFGSYGLSPSFSRDIYEYELRIDAGTENLQQYMRYSAVDEHAEVVFWPYITSVPVGETLLTVQVIAENGDKQDYHITIYRPQPETKPPVTQPPATRPPETQPTTPEPTTPEPTTEEPTTEEPTTPEETTPEETSEEPTTEPGESKEVILLSETVRLTVEPIPDYITAPEGYELSEMLDEDGNPFSCLVQSGLADPDHCIVYGAREETDADGKTDIRHGFYLYDTKEKTLQRYGLMLPVPLETSTEVPSTENQPSAEETTPAETTAEPTVGPTTVPPTTVPPTLPSATESIPDRQQAAGSGLPAWFWAVLAALAVLCAVLLLLFLRTKRRLDDQLERAETLTPEEEQAFLTMNKSTLLQKAKEANRPADPYAINDIQVEDLNDVFEAEEVPEKETD